MIEVDVKGTTEGLKRLQKGLTIASGRALIAAVDAGAKAAAGTTAFKDGTKKRRLFTRNSIRGSIDLARLMGTIHGGGATKFLNFGTMDYRITKVPKGHVVPFSPHLRTGGGRKGIQPRLYMFEAREAAVKTLTYGMEFYLGRLTAK